VLDESMREHLEKPTGETKIVVFVPRDQGKYDRIYDTKERGNKSQQPLKRRKFNSSYWSSRINIHEFFSVNLFSFKAGLGAGKFGECCS
jgi:hypothetical protein